MCLSDSHKCCEQSGAGAHFVYGYSSIDESQNTRKFPSAYVSWMRPNTHKGKTKNGSNVFSLLNVIFNLHPPSHCRRWSQCQQPSGWSQVLLPWCSAGTETHLDLWQTWSSEEEEPCFSSNELGTETVWGRLREALHCHLKRAENSHFHPCRRTTCCRPNDCTGSPGGSSNPLKYPRWTSSGWRSEPGQQQPITHTSQTRWCME